MRSLLAFVLFICVADCKLFRSDYNFDSDINGWLKMHPIPATFQDAMLRCRLEGAVLASPSDPIMASAIQKEMIKRPVFDGKIFTGIHATFSKGDFFSIDGIPLNDMRLQWMPNEPDNKNNDEECILYKKDKTIADVRCSETHPYICYKENSPNMFVTGCGTVDPEYNPDARTGKCYKFHKVPRNWSRAFMTCSAEGGHLVIINSQEEFKVINELMHKNPISSIPKRHPLTKTDQVFIGFHDWNEIGVWTTIHGNSLVEAGFEIWNSGQPNNLANGEHCGSLIRNGNLNDINCNELIIFICEKNPESLQNY